MLIKTKRHLTSGEVAALVERDVQASQSRGMLANWPMCARCMKPVRAYGVEKETASFFWIWAECGHGNRYLRERRVMQLRKPRGDMKEHPGNWLRDRIRHMVFFA